MSYVSNAADIAVIEQVKETVSKSVDTVTLSNGIEVKLKPVPLKVLQEVYNRIKDGPPPMVMNENKGVKEPNPADPQYLQHLQDNEQARFDALTNIIFAVGIEPVDKIPDVSEWLPQLKLLEKLGTILLPDNIDWDSELEVQFIYFKYTTNEGDYIMLTRHYGVREDDVQAASESFPNNS